MEPRTATRMPAPDDLARTLRFRREEITTKFPRDLVDVDDTVPVALYSQPYERLDIQPDSSPYERIEIELTEATDVPADLVHPAVYVVLAISILCFTFTLGVAFAFLVL